MSQKLYVRRCRRHQLNLDEMGDVLFCPAGPHVCEDFQVIDRATGAIANEVPEEEGAVAEVKANKETGMPTKTELKEHGTAARYWQGCRCQPCRDAVNEHVKALKAKREGSKVPVKAAPSGDTVQRRATKAVPKGRARTLSSIAGEIQTLRSQLARAEAEFARAVSAVLPNHRVTEVGE